MQLRHVSLGRLGESLARLLLTAKQAFRTLFSRKLHPKEFFSSIPFHCTHSFVFLAIPKQIEFDIIHHLHFTIYFKGRTMAFVGKSTPLSILATLGVATNLIFFPANCLAYLHAGGDRFFEFRQLLERYIMKRQLLFIAAISAVFLSGCSTPLAPLNFSVPNVGLSQKKIDAEMKSLNVSIARPDEQTGTIPPEISVTFPQLWTSALTDALNKMAIFQDDATKKLNLSVKILKIDIPGFGASMTTETAARYELMDRKTGDLIFTQDITSSGTVPFDYAFKGIIRARESINRSIQNNITQFLQALETVDVQKPMFPAKVGVAK